MQISKQQINRIKPYIPSFFGILFLFGLLTSSPANPLYATGIPSVSLYGGSLVALILSALSLVKAWKKHKYTGIHLMNWLWFGIMLFFWISTIVVLLTWDNFLGH